MKDTIRCIKRPNGLTVCLRQTNLFHDYVCLTLSVKVGSLNDGKDQGIAHLLEHCNMAFEKYRRPEPAFCYRARAYTDYYSTNYIYTCKKDEIKRLFPLLQDLISGNYLDSKTFSEIKQDVLAEYQKKQADTDYRTLIKFFGNTVYATELPVGNPEIVCMLSFPEVVAFFRKWYVPELMALVVVGDLPADVDKEIENLKFPSWGEDTGKDLHGKNLAFSSGRKFSPVRNGLEKKDSVLRSVLQDTVKTEYIQKQSPSFHYFYMVPRGLDGADGMDISKGAAGQEQYLKTDFLYDFCSDVIAKAFENWGKYCLGKKCCQRSFYAPLKEMLYFTVTAAEKVGGMEYQSEKSGGKKGFFLAQSEVELSQLRREISSLVLDWLDADFEAIKGEYRAAFRHSENYISLKAMNQQCIEHYIYERPLVDYTKETQVLSVYLEQIEKSTIKNLISEILEKSVIVCAQGEEDFLLETKRGKENDKS